MPIACYHVPQKVQGFRRDGDCSPTTGFSGNPSGRHQRSTGRNLRCRPTGCPTRIGLDFARRFVTRHCARQVSDWHTRLRGGGLVMARVSVRVPDVTRTVSRERRLQITSHPEYRYRECPPGCCPIGMISRIIDWIILDVARQVPERHVGLRSRDASGVRVSPGLWVNQCP